MAMAAAIAIGVGWHELKRRCALAPRSNRAQQT
jgi:hypothetical protein